MAASDPRDRLLATIESEREWWRRLVDEIGRDRMAEPGPMGEWTFKDLAAHLVGWRNRTIRRLEAAAEGRPEPPNPWPAELDDDDPINAWFHEQASGRSVEDVLDETDGSYARLADAVRRLPDEAITSPDHFAWLEGTSLGEANLFSHVHDEHEPSIRAWLERVRA